MTVQELMEILSDADPEAVVTVRYPETDPYADDDYCDESLNSVQIDFVGDEEVIFDMTY